MTDNYTPLPRQEGGQPGNTNARKITSVEGVLELVDKYIHHVKEGLSDNCFPYAKKETLDKYVKGLVVELDTDLKEDIDNRIELAQQERALFWERIGIAGTVGKLKGFNAKSWEFNMQNRFKWTNRADVTSDGEAIKGPTIFIPKEVDE